MTFQPFFSFLQAGSGQPSALLGIVPYVAIAAIFYFLFFLPMQRQKKQQQQMLASLQPGKVVVTTGGIVGTIVSTKEDVIVIQVKPDNVKLQFARHAVSGVVPEEEVKKY
jgi:preprotein translocase subunit YajC